MGAEWRRGQMSAWLQKKKTGSSMVRVRQYNKRYFTIDFDSHVFFYAHAENSKKVSSVIPFADFVDVRLADTQLDKGDNVSECSRQSKVSLLRRLSGSVSRENDQERIVTLMTRPARMMELLCSSTTEALQWFEAFKAAMVFSGGTSGSGTDGGTVSSSLPPENAGAGADARAAPGAAASAASAPAGSGGGDGSNVDQASLHPVPKRGTFLDFAEPEEVPSSGDGPGAAEATDLGGHHSGTPNAEQVVAVVEMPARASLKACDFGFGADEGEEEDSDSSEGSFVGAPHQGTAVGSAGGEVTSIGASPSAGVATPSGLPSAPGSGGGVDGGTDAHDDAGAAASSYRDRHEGLSMQERLENLDFSDDDEDDDDPLGLGTAKGSAG